MHFITVPTCYLYLSLLAGSHAESIQQATSLDAEASGREYSAKGGPVSQYKPSPAGPGIESLEPTTFETKFINQPSMNGPGPPSAQTSRNVGQLTDEKTPVTHATFVSDGAGAFSELSLLPEFPPAEASGASTTTDLQDTFAPTTEEIEKQTNRGTTAIQATVASEGPLATVRTGLNGDFLPVEPGWSGTMIPSSTTRPNGQPTDHTIAISLPLITSSVAPGTTGADPHWWWTPSQTTPPITFATSQGVTINTVTTATLSQSVGADAGWWGDIY